MLFSYLVIFILLLIILLAFLLLAPFSLSLNIGKKGPMVWGSIKLAWLGLTLRKVEIMPRSADDLLASIRKEDAGEEVQAVDERKANCQEKTIEKLTDQRENKGREHNETGSEMTDTIRSPSIQSLINAAPALAKILWDLLKSIHFKKISCRLCFGLNDPAQTAIICGYLWSLASAIGIFSTNISIDPWFEGERLEGELIAEIEARLLWPVFAVIKAMRVREIRLLLREMLGWT
ncbi:MAG: hypothetical protein QG575_734 [Euryarchaeota archaeon]|nr:hypothetical protein [Euryarchaeota archaeon]